MLLLTAAALLLGSCSTKGVFFSIPVPEFTHTNNHPGHMVIVYQPDSKAVSDIEIFNQYSCIRKQALSYVGKGATNVIIGAKIDAANNEWKLSGVVEDFMRDVEGKCGGLFTSKINDKYVVRGRPANGNPAPASFTLDFANIELNNTPGAIDKYTTKLSVLTYNLHLLRRRVIGADDDNPTLPGYLTTCPSIQKEVSKEILDADADVVLLQEVPSAAYEKRFKTGDRAAMVSQLQAKYPHQACVNASLYLDNCILSKLPLDHIYKQHINPSGKGPSKRALISGTVDLILKNGRKEQIDVVSGHFDRNDYSQIKNYLGFRPVILGGDFNADISVSGFEGWSSVHNLSRNGQPHPMTASHQKSPTANTAIDFIVASPKAQKMVTLSGNIEVGKSLHSDHNYVLATLNVFDPSGPYITLKGQASVNSNKGSSPPGKSIPSTASLDSKGGKTTVTPNETPTPPRGTSVSQSSSDGSSAVKKVTTEGISVKKGSTGNGKATAKTAEDIENGASKTLGIYSIVVCTVTLAFSLIL